MTERKKNTSVPDELIPGMMNVYTKELGRSTSSEKALDAATEFVHSNGCDVVRKTVQRTIGRQMGGTYKGAVHTSSVKIDASREDEIQSFQNKIEHIIDVLLDRFHAGVQKNAPDQSMIQLADAIARQRELQIKLLALSPKKAITSTASVDVDGGGKIVLAQSIEHEE